MKKSLLLIVILAFLTGCTPKSMNDPLSINASEVDTYIKENPNATYLDVRSSKEYEMGHIDKFKNVKADQVLDYVKENNKESDKIVIISRSGTESKQVIEELATNGYQDVVNVSNGYLNYPNK